MSGTGLPLHGQGDGRATRRAAIALCLLALFAALPVRADTLTLDALMAALRAVPQRRAAFEETKHFAVLTQPLVRRGVLDYRRPDRLEMTVASPYAEHVVVAGDTLTVERATGVTQLTLSSQPALAAWIDSLRATLAGDAAALTTRFDVKVAGSLASWHLDLTPRDPALAGVVSRVTVDGRDGEPTRYSIDEARGDSTVVVITPRGTP